MKEISHERLDPKNIECYSKQETELISQRVKTFEKWFSKKLKFKVYHTNAPTNRAEG